VKKSVPNMMRLEKYIATSGIASRRAVKRSIQAGLVTVNGEPVLVPGHPINIETDSVEFEGKQVEPLAEHIYLMLNKPAGCLTTRSDERGRPTVMELVADLRDTIYPVGRLDLETEGLLLFTNDGDFAYRLLHPSHEVEKTYLVWVKGVPREDAIQQLRQGVTIPSGTTAPAKVKRLRVSKDSATTKFEMVIHEGKKRQVRLMFKAVGHPVIRLKRVRIGNLRLGNLPSGQYRFLSPGEISELMLL
jgi:pseudouridine synthase